MAAASVLLAYANALQESETAVAEAASASIVSITGESLAWSSHATHRGMHLRHSSMMMHDEI